MLALASLALGTSSQQPGGAASSRLPLSRIADGNAPLQQLKQSSDVLLDCVPESVKCLRGGASGTKCDVVLVGCGVPKRGMGWYHAKQMLDGDVPSAHLTAVVEPWFLGAGADSPPGETFKEWADEMEKEHGTKFVKDISELTIQVRLRGIATLAPLRRASASRPARGHDSLPQSISCARPSSRGGRRFAWLGVMSRLWGWISAGHSQ